MYFNVIFRHVRCYLVLYVLIFFPLHLVVLHEIFLFPSLNIIYIYNLSLCLYICLPLFFSKFDFVVVSYNLNYNRLENFQLNT